MNYNTHIIVLDAQVFNLRFTITDGYRCGGSKLNLHVQLCISVATQHFSSEICNMKLSKT